MLPVVILSFNHPEITIRTLKSVENRDLSPIYLIHNGSEAKHIERLQSTFPNVVHVVLDKNQGYAGGANLGLKVALYKHDWCLFLTNDCEIIETGDLPEFPAMIAPQIEIRNTGRIHSIGGYLEKNKARLRHAVRDDEFSSTQHQKYIPGTAFIIHKDVFFKTGGFDESLFTYWEDVDFSVRAEQLGFPLLIDSTWKFKHGVGKTCHKHSIYTLYYFQRNRKIVSSRYSNKASRLQMYGTLTKDWTKLSYKLIKTKRYSDLKLLFKAIRD